MAFWNGTQWVRDEPTPQSRRRHRWWGAATKAGPITLLIFGLFAGSALAAPGTHGKPPADPTGSCSVTPDPVAVGADYTIWGSSLPANSIVNVDVSDSHGTASFIMGTDAYGNVSVTWHPYWAGTSTVYFSYVPRNKIVLLATCQFQVAA